MKRKTRTAAITDVTMWCITRKDDVCYGHGLSVCLSVCLYSLSYDLHRTVKFATIDWSNSRRSSGQRDKRLWKKTLKTRVENAGHSYCSINGTIYWTEIHIVTVTLDVFSRSFEVKMRKFNFKKTECVHCKVTTWQHLWLFISTDICK